MPSVGSCGDPPVHGHGLQDRVQALGSQSKAGGCTSVSPSREVMLLLWVPELRARCSTDPEPSSELCHGQEAHRSSCLRLEGATCFLVLKKATKHRDRAPVSRPRAPPWGYTLMGEPRADREDPSKGDTLSQCAVLHHHHTLHAGTGCLGMPGQGPSPTFSEKPRGIRTLPAGQGLTPWRGRRGSSTGAAGRSAAEPERRSAASWPRLCGARP